LVILGTAAAASEVVPDGGNPYSVISDRNVFHLNPAPDPKAAEAPKPVELPKVMLTGFVGKGSSMKVLFAIPPAKDSKDNTVTYLSLSPGDRDHDVQLVKIHLKEEEVEILNAGTAQTLSAKSNSYEAMLSAPHQGGGGGRPGEMRGFPPGIHRPMLPGFNPPGAAPAEEHTFPSAARQGGGGSAVIAGGGESSGAIVSGGSGGGFGGLGAGQYAQSGGAIGNTITTGNNVGEQIANALSNPQASRLQTPISTGPVVPVEEQGPRMALGKLTSGGGGPPLPPIIQQQLEEATGGNQ
jgi:hypothetical protein